MPSLLPLVLAAVSGLAMAVQGAINSALGKVLGLLQVTLVVHMVAFLLVALLLFFGSGFAAFGRAGQAPWYLYLGGVLGVVITYGVVASIPKLGVAVATTAIIVGQVGMAAGIDHFGLFGLQQMPFTWWKAAGMVLLAAGARLMLN